MEKLNILKDIHFKNDKSRSSLSNLIKKIKLDKELFNFIDDYLEFGTFKQKVYHYIYKKGSDELICPVCSINKINWVDRNNCYRSVCSTKCSGKLNKVRNSDKKIYINPELSTKNDFINFFLSNNRKLTESNLIKIYPDLVSEVNKLNFRTKSYSEKVYFYLYDLRTRPVCEHCNYNFVEFDTFSKGYHTYCSVKCSSNSIEKKTNIENTCLEKYGVKNIGEVTREKAVETMIERYGSHISKTEQYKKKFKETSIKNYGVEHPFKSDVVIKLIKDTCYNRYGDVYIKHRTDKMLKTKKESGLIYKWTDNELKDISNYRSAVSYYTEKSYIENKYILNPNDLERGMYTNHLDHIYPVIEVWKNNIPPKLISDYKNLRLISSFDNLSKCDRTDMLLEDFYDLIK